MSGPEDSPENGAENGAENGPEISPETDVAAPDEAVGTRSFTLEVYPEQVAVVRLGPGAEVPAWAESSSIFAVLATATETTVVSAKRSVPSKARQAGPFTAFKVEGELDFAMTGVLADLLVPLALAEVPVFTLSTFPTDWVLVPRELAETAAEAWTAAGHQVVVAQPESPSKGKS